MALEHRDLPLKILEMSPCSTRKGQTTGFQLSGFCEVESLNTALKSLTVPWAVTDWNFNAFSQRCRRPGPIIHQRWEEPCYSPVSSNMVSWKIPISFNEFLIKTYYWEHIMKTKGFSSQPLPAMFDYRRICHLSSCDACATRPDVIRNFMGYLILDTCNILPNIL